METTKKKATKKEFQCQECGKLMTTAQAQKAAFGDDGCPKCRSSDVDLAV